MVLGSADVPVNQVFLSAGSAAHRPTKQHISKQQAQQQARRFSSSLSGHLIDATAESGGSVVSSQRRESERRRGKKVEPDRTECLDIHF